MTINPMAAYKSKYQLKDIGDSKRDGGIIAVLPNGSEAHIQPWENGGRPQSAMDRCAVCVMKGGEMVANLHDDICFERIEKMIDDFVAGKGIIDELRWFMFDKDGKQVAWNN